MHNAPISQAPNLPDGTLDQIVSSINVEHEQIGPNRYIADLGVLFDRARAAEFLGVEGGEIQRSAPMLLDPDHGHRRHGDQRRAAQCVAARLGAVPHLAEPDRLCPRAAGSGADPLLVNAAQTSRPGRGWWRNIIDLYGAADILVAEVQLQRLYPGGPARARFIARHGPDNRDRRRLHAHRAEQRRHTRR